MTRWVKSVSGRSYRCGDVTIGSAPIPINETVYSSLKNNRVIASLIKGGSIVISSAAPTTKTDSALEQENALLKEEIASLKSQATAKKTTKKTKKKTTETEETNAETDTTETAGTDTEANAE